MSGPWEQYQTPSTAKPWEQYQPQAVEAPKEGGGFMQSLGNTAAGLVRGAGSIGATLLAPIDMASDALAGRGLSLQSNRERRAAMDAGLETMGAQPDSLLYKGGKLAGEIAGTAGAGGAVANGLGRSAMLAKNAAPLLDAIRTGGMAAKGLTGPAGLAVRSAGGAINGLVSAGMVNPDDAQAGAMIGGALPGSLSIAGKAGSAIAGKLRGPDVPADVLKAVQDARALGYVIPPTQAKPTLGNRLLEGFAGKLTTAQNASAKNAEVTNSLAAKALGLPADAKIDAGTLKTIRDAAGQAYEAIGASGVIQPGPKYTKALDAIAAPHAMAAKGFPGAKPSPVLDLVESLKSDAFDASSAVAKIKELRSAADDAFRAGNSDVARASKSAATALEDAVGEHLQQTGQKDLYGEFVKARQLIAKTYTVEKALNPTSGTIDARKLASEIKKGKPLTGELRQAGEFAARFPKAAQPLEGMGSLPQTSPLDWVASGTLSGLTANPALMATVAARPMARRAALSNMVQNRLATPASVPSFGLLSNPDFAAAGYRAAPVGLLGLDR